MKPDIHPDYHPVVFRDASTGDEFLTRSTVTSPQSVQWSDGATYPLVVVEVSSAYPSVLDRQRPGRRHRRSGREIPPPLRHPQPPGAGHLLMAVPKRRLSRANTHARRSQWKATAPELVPIVVAGGTHLVPRRLIRFYQRFPDKLKD